MFEKDIYYFKLFCGIFVVYNVLFRCFLEIGFFWYGLLFYNSKKVIWDIRIEKLILKELVRRGGGREWMEGVNGVWYV